jgi:hypothetical protein
MGIIAFVVPGEPGKVLGMDDILELRAYLRSNDSNFATGFKETFDFAICYSSATDN